MRRFGAGVAVLGLAGLAWVGAVWWADAPVVPLVQSDAAQAEAAAAVVAASSASGGVSLAVAGAATVALKSGLPSDPGRDLVREIQDALALGTPAGALTAAELIGRCLGADRRVTELFEAQSQQIFQGVLAKKMLSLFGVDEQRLIEHMQKEQRNCQGLDAQTRSMRPALLQRALDARVEGAPLRYLEWLVETQGDKTDPAQLQVLRQRIRDEADAGSMVAMYALASEKLPLAVSAEARHSYLRATDHIEESWVKDDAMAGFLKPVLAMRQLLGGRGADPSLTPEQLQVAEQQALRLFEAYRRRELARHRSVG